MKPACEPRDRDLLMMVHRQLGPWQTLRTRVHVWGCPTCRARLRRLEGLSFALATGLRNPRLGTLALRPALRNGLAGVGLLAMLLSVLGWLVSADLAQANAAPGVSTAPKSCPLAAKRAAATNHPAFPRD